ATHPAAAGLRPRRAASPAAPPAPLRRRAHVRLSLLLAAGGGARAPAGSLRPRRRLVRGLEPLLLVRLPGRRRRAYRGVRAALLRAGAPERLLLLAPALGAPAPGRPEGPGDGAAGPLRAPTRTRAGRASGPRGWGFSPG